MATVSVLNTDAGLSGKTLVNAEDAQNVTGAKSFNRSPNPPFVVQAGSANVPNLDADKLDGQDWTSPTITTPTITSPTISTSIISAKLVAGICDGRLTLTSGTPVTTADVSGVTNVYWTPYKGTNIALYDGSAKWTLLSFTETTLALGTLTNNLPYDVFAYNNSGTLALEALAWSSTTARATALVLQDGVLVKSGATTRRFLGTFTTTSTTTTEDSATKRHLSNYYNRDRRPLFKQDSGAAYNYTTTTWRQAHADATMQVEATICYAEITLDLTVAATAGNATTNVVFAIAIGEDSTSTPVTTGFSGPAVTNTTGTTGEYRGLFGRLVKKPAVGKHVYAALEDSGASGTTTWYTNPTYIAGWTQSVSGLDGWIEG